MELLAVDVVVQPAGGAEVATELDAAGLTVALNLQGGGQQARSIQKHRPSGVGGCIRFAHATEAKWTACLLKTSKRELVPTPLPSLFAPSAQRRTEGTAATPPSSGRFRESPSHRDTIDMCTPSRSMGSATESRHTCSFFQ